MLLFFDCPHEVSEISKIKAVALKKWYFSVMSFVFVVCPCANVRISTMSQQYTTILKYAKVCRTFCGGVALFVLVNGYPKIFFEIL
jgi:hypothetical protein